MITNNYSIEDFEKPEDKQKGRIGAGVFLLIVLIILFFPWFETIYPVPEAEGLMASFGNVEVAGGGSENPTDEVQEEETTPNTEETETTEEVVEDDVETVEDDNSPSVSEETPSDNPTTNNNTDDGPKVNNNALFPGDNNGGTGTGEGPGKQGTPDGKGDLGGTGRGDEGDGDGALGARRNLTKCNDYKDANKATWNEEGVAVVTICVNHRGKVISAKINRRKSTITSSRLIDLAVGCAKEYTYQKAPGQPDACGDITIRFGIQ